MEVFYFKANPKVCEYLKLTSANRFSFADGCKMLWMEDVRGLDRLAWYEDRKGLMRRYGMVQLLPHEAKAEQDAEQQGNPSIVLPIAEDPNFVWYPPKKEETPEEIAEEVAEEIEEEIEEVESDLGDMEEGGEI